MGLFYLRVCIFVSVCFSSVLRGKMSPCREKLHSSDTLKCVNVSPPPSS